MKKELPYVYFYDDLIFAEFFYNFETAKKNTVTKIISGIVCCWKILKSLKMTITNKDYNIFT